MEFDEINTKLIQIIKKFLKRIRINQIVGMAPIHADGKSWTEIECEAHIKASSFNKIPIINAFFLNDHKNAKILLHKDEYNELKESLRKCAQFLTDEIVEFCKYGENQYELNKLIRNVILEIDGNIQKMNYEIWQDEIFPSKPKDTFFVLFGNKKVSKDINFMDIRSHCWPLVEHEFGYRESLLYRLKNYLIDIYSEYLLLPAIIQNPKIAYTCSATDLCEVLMAIGNTKEITDSEKLKAILMNMFGISKDKFNKASHEIRNRKVHKSIFVKQLSDNLDKIPSTWKEPKRS